MKVCARCNNQKELSYFYSDGKGGLKSICKECEKKKAKEYYKRNKQKVLSKYNKKPEVLKRCKTCEESFMGKSTKIYCSIKCRNSRNRETKITCVGCGNKATVRSYGAKYCSHDCYHKHGDHSMKGSYVVKRHCATCGGLFEGKGSNATYCCDECHPRNIPSSSVFFCNCDHCGELFTTQRSKMYCSDECSYKSQIEKQEEYQREYWLSQPKRPCKQCGELFQPEFIKSKSFCSRECKKERQRRLSRSGKDHRSRARKFGVFHENVDKVKVFERDKWKCQDCGIRTSKRLLGKNTNKDNEPTLDHIIPISRGGSHSYHNVQLLCRKCNVDKSNSHRGQVPMLFNTPRRLVSIE